MNARFRKGKKYSFSNRSSLDPFLIETNAILIYDGYDKKGNTYNFKYPDYRGGQLCDKEWLDNGLLTYEEVK